MSSSRSVILLAAGQGSRLRPLTQEVPKCLLSMGEKRVLDLILESIPEVPRRELVVVVGHGAERVKEHVGKNYSNRNINLVYNQRYKDDINILSVELGVNALKYPEHGYIIIETDLLMDASSWALVFGDSNVKFSFWVTSGRYNRNLTGGIVSVCEDGCTVSQIRYAPVYDSSYLGWYKMVGILSVGPDNVQMDRLRRREAIAISCGQYYMEPWIKNIRDLPSRVLDIPNSGVYSFNTVREYHYASKFFRTNNCIRS